MFQSVCVYILSVQTKARPVGFIYFIFAGTRGKMSAASGGESLSAALFVMLIRAIVWRAPLTHFYLSECLLSFFTRWNYANLVLDGKIKYSLILANTLIPLVF